MAPDRGEPARTSSQTVLLQRTNQAAYLAAHSSENQNFTLRGIVIGLLVGLIICFSNTYFGLQTGWVSAMTMPSSLIGFAFFKTLGKHLGRWGTDSMKFTPVENVLIQTVAGSMGTMPLGCGFVGVIPAMQFLMEEKDVGGVMRNGSERVLDGGKTDWGEGLDLSLWKLIVWSLGLCFFGVVFAVPLRKQVIIREKLRFPSGTATALMIDVLHGKEDAVREVAEENNELLNDTEASGVLQAGEPPLSSIQTAEDVDDEGLSLAQRNAWKAKVRLLVIAFTASGSYTLGTYFFPILRKLPVFGTYLASAWLWTLNPSLAYVGQGIIMGPATTLHMLFGAILGWGVLSPLAKQKGWAPGPVEEWENGSRGFIVWISLAIMLVDSIINLGYIAMEPVAKLSLRYYPDFQNKISKRDWKGLLHLSKTSSSKINYEPLSSTDESFPESSTTATPSSKVLQELPEPDAPPEHLVNTSTVTVGLVLSIAICIISIRVVFGSLIPLYAIVIAVLMALLLSIMGVRALGETDLNPVSGISKLTQLFFALVIPNSNPNAVLINLIAGAVSEAGALQAGDLMQDLKTGHLLGAAPNAQFWGQIIGSAVGAVASAGIYKMYVGVYQVPGDLFQVPTGYVWIFTARLVTGKGLPAMALEWSIGAAAIFALTTCARIMGAGTKWHSWIPGGIAVAVGMYNPPSFTLARTIGGLVSWYWTSWKGRTETSIVVLASGLILGEGVVSIVNLLLASLKVPHL